MTKVEKLELELIEVDQSVHRMLESARHQLEAVAAARVREARLREELQEERAKEVQEYFGHRPKVRS